MKIINQIKYLLFKIITLLSFFIIKIKTKINNSVEIRGLIYRPKFTIKGNNNKILIEKGSYLKNLKLKITGNNNTVLICKNVRSHIGVEILCLGSNSSLVINENTEILESQFILGTNTEIKIGKNCLFSSNIYVRSTDGHRIYKKETNKLINEDKDIIIGNHVWVCNGVNILKGSAIGDGVVVGSASVIANKIIPPNCIVAGNPSVIVRENIFWEL